MMKTLLKEIWNSNRRGFIHILLLDVILSLTGSIGIVMLIPILNLVNVSVGNNVFWNQILLPFSNLSYVRQVFILLFVYVFLIVIKALVSQRLSIRKSEFVEQLDLQMRSRLYKAVSHAEWEQISHLRRTDFVDLFTNQCGQFGHSVMEVISALSSLVFTAMQLVLACWLSFPLTVLVILFGSAFMRISRPFLNKSREYGKEIIEINQSFFCELFDQLSSLKETRTYGVEKENTVRFEKISHKFYDSHMRYTHMSVLSQTLYTIGAAILLAVALGLSVIIANTGTAQLMVLIYIFSRLWPVFSSWQSKLQRIQSCVPAYETVIKTCRELSEGASIKAVPGKPISFSRNIVFHNVSFTYQNTTEAVLKNINVQMNYGTVIALIGRSGVGKSTIADLLMGLLKTSSGKILVDGQELTDETVNSWRKMVGYVPQEPLILNTSLRENLLRFHPEATEDEMIQALKKTLVWPVVEKLEYGLDTVLGEQGIRLSGGERQRLVLARALMGTPRLIILDEATSALDFESEMVIRDAIRNLRGNTTILIIAHRLTTIRAADYGIVLEDGMVAEWGTLPELLSKENSYLERMVNVE